MRNKTCCFTGHRKIPSEQYDAIAGRLRVQIIDLIDKGYLYFGTGGAIGFDTMAAQMLLELREEYPQIKLILILPCSEQTRGWSLSDIAIYEGIKARCNKIVYTSEAYTKDCMFKRNRHMVDNSSVCVCYLTRENGGTAYTVQYAKGKGLNVIYI